MKQKKGKEIVIMIKGLIDRNWSFRWDISKKKKKKTIYEWKFSESISIAMMIICVIIIRFIFARLRMTPDETARRPLQNSNSSFSQ